MHIFPLQEGSYSVDSTKKFIPFDPDVDDWRKRPGSLFIHVQPFLVKTDTDLILFDAGLGFKNNQDELILHQNIRNAGFDPEDVTLVLMSHLHYDHTGGLVIGFSRCYACDTARRVGNRLFGKVIIIPQIYFRNFAAGCYHRFC
jgi:glyoxylase-like metal-dependent hydrolase (beta-lactamase superfamily II)